MRGTMLGTMSSRYAIVQRIDAEIERLQRARALLTGHTVPLKRGMPDAAPSEATRKDQAERKQTVLSEGMSRWAKAKIG